MRNGIPMLGFRGRHEDFDGDLGGGDFGVEAGSDAEADSGLLGGGVVRMAGGSANEGVGGVRMLDVTVDEEEESISLSRPSNAEPETPETLLFDRDRARPLANGWFFGRVGDLGARGRAELSGTDSCRG